MRGLIQRHRPRGQRQLLLRSPRDPALHNRRRHHRRLHKVSPHNQRLHKLSRHNQRLHKVSPHSQRLHKLSHHSQRLRNQPHRRRASLLPNQASSSVRLLPSRPNRFDPLRSRPQQSLPRSRHKPLSRPHSRPSLPLDQYSQPLRRPQRRNPFLNPQLPKRVNNRCRRKI